MAATTIENLSINIRRTGDTASTSMRGLSQSLSTVKTSSKAASKGLGSLASSLQRIAFYRVIRSIIKAIGEAFKEGSENAYFFSKAVGGELAAALDLLSTKSFTMTNQLGAAWATLLQTLQPILLKIIELIRMAAEVVTQFFALLGGKRTYLKAIDYSKDWATQTANGAKAAKEWKNQLLGFDEINRLEEPSSSSGGSGKALPNYSQMFEEVELPDWAQGLLEKLEDLKSRLKLAVEDVFFDWDDLNPEQIAEKAIVGLTGLLGGATGFLIGGVPGAIIGTLLGVGIGLEIDALTFDHDGVISNQELGQMLKYALRGITGGIIGFTVLGGVRGALLGATIGISMEALIQNLDFFAGENNTGSMILDNLTKALTMFAGAKIGFKIGGGGGAIIGATIGLGIENAIENFMFTDTSGWGAADWITAIVNTLAPTVGAAIGFSVGGPGGAAIGAIIGIGISLLVKNISWKNPVKNQTKEVVQEYVDGLENEFAKAEPASGYKQYLQRWKDYANREYREIGKDSAAGIDVGLEDEGNKRNWFQRVWDKIVSNVKRSFGIASPSTVFAEMGMYLMEGLGNGMDSNFSPIQTVVDNILQLFSNMGVSASDIFSYIGFDLSAAFESLSSRAHIALQNIIDGLGWVIGYCVDAISALNDVANANAARIQADGSIYLEGLASGGLVTEGQLFVARESGPEMVGTIGGQTAVANNDQIVQGISAGVFNAVVSAMSASGGGSDKPVVIYMDGKEIARTTTKYQNQYARAGTM